MKNYTYSQKGAALRASLYDFMRKNHPEAVEVCRGGLRLKSDHSVWIDQKMSAYVDWADQSGSSVGTHGNSIDFLVKYMGYSVVDAVLALSEGQYIDTFLDKPYNSVSVPEKPDIKTGADIVFPEPVSGQYKQLYAYLTITRKIPAEMVQWLIKSKLIYQTDFHGLHNIVFMNKEKDWGEIHGTLTVGKSFHQLVKGSRGDGFWGFTASREPKVCYVCEGSIDTISLSVMRKRLNLEKDACYAAIGGAGKQGAIDRLKQKYRVVIAVDNDEDAGPKCRQRNSDCEAIIPEHKDWNEDLCGIIKAT